MIEYYSIFQFIHFCQFLFAYKHIFKFFVLKIKLIRIIFEKEKDKTSLILN